MFSYSCRAEWGGDYYFEKKEVLSKRYLPKEHEAQYLALCPVCAAKYDEFVKTDDEAMAKLREKITSSEDCGVPILLGNEAIQGWYPFPVDNE